MSDAPTPSPLRPLMRRIAVMVGVLTAVAEVLALWFNAPWAALGIPVGVALTVFNMRLLDRQVAKVSIGDPDDPKEKKAARNAIGRSAGLRLGIVTAVVVVSLIIAREFSLGIVIGLAISQVVFLANAFGVMRAGMNSRNWS